MVDADKSDRCPQCTAPLPPHAPAGLCPKCLLQAGLGNEPDLSDPGGTSPAPGFALPAIEEIAPFFPQLEFLELVGRGGMGAVYKARQKDLDRLVAIKILPPEVGADPAFTERFLREARALAKLSHSNIVTVYDFGQAGGLCYFMMEYVEGTNLRHLMATSKLRPDEALAIIPQICEALQFAHNEGVVHRDIKPENILVSHQGDVKIADFGLVKLLGATSPDYSLTGTQQVMGTVHYMAPEQVQHTHAVDHRADIYSLGVVFYEMLTGQLPIGRFDPPSKKVAIDARLDEIVLRSLESDPLRRYQHVSDVRTDIESLATAKPPQVAPENPKPIPAKPSLPPGTTPRFSRKAILGAMWAPLFFIAVLLSLVTVQQAPVAEPATVLIETTDGEQVVQHTTTEEVQHETTVQYGPDILQWILIFAILLPGILAPFGTTILGVVALSDIRHSQGRLQGLPLAVFDALFYPLLVLDGLLVFVVGVLCAVVIVLISKLFFAGLAYWISVVFTLLPSIPLCILIDFFIIRAVWKRNAAPV